MPHSHGGREEPSPRPTRRQNGLRASDPELTPRTLLCPRWSFRLQGPLRSPESPSLESQGAET